MQHASCMCQTSCYVLCNRFISLTDYHGQLMGLILHKGLSTNSGRYLSMIKVGNIWFEWDDVKTNQIEFNHFCNSNTVDMLFYKRTMWWKHLRGIGLVTMDAVCWVSWGEDIKTPYLTGSSWRSPFMHCLLPFIFVTFFDSLAFVSYCFYCILILILSCFFWTSIWNIQWRWPLYVRTLCDLLSCDSSPICKKVVVMSLHTFTLLMTIRNTLWTIRLLFSLRVFLHACARHLATTLQVASSKDASRIYHVNTL